MGTPSPSLNPLWHQIPPQKTPRLPPRSRKTGKPAVHLRVLLVASSLPLLLLLLLSLASSTTGVGRNEFPIVNYATAADNANTGITIHSERDQNTNFHEYFPPNMTYSTSTPQSDA